MDCYFSGAYLKLTPYLQCLIQGICLLQVFAGCKPLLDKTLGILVEGLIDTFLSLFHENKDRDLRSLDANGFCQLMLEVKSKFSSSWQIVLFVNPLSLGHDADAGSSLH